MWQAWMSLLMWNQIHLLTTRTVTKARLAKDRRHPPGSTDCCPYCCRTCSPPLRFLRCWEVWWESRILLACPNAEVQSGAAPSSVFGALVCCMLQWWIQDCFLHVDDETSRTFTFILHMSHRFYSEDIRVVSLSVFVVFLQSKQGNFNLCITYWIVLIIKLVSTCHSSTLLVPKTTCP